MSGINIIQVHSHVIILSFRGMFIMYFITVITSKNNIVQKKLYLKKQPNKQKLFFPKSPYQRLILYLYRVSVYVVYASPS